MRLREYAWLAEPRRLREAGVFVAEGRLVVGRVIENRSHAVRSVLVTEAGLKAMEAAFGALPADVPIFVAPSGVLESIVGFQFHRGCLAMASRPVGEQPVDPLICDARRVVILDSVANPDNVGAIFRNAAAFAVDAVLLGPGCADPLYRKALRTSMGAILTVPWANLTEILATLERLRSKGFLVIALSLRPPTIELREYVARLPPASRIALILGAEAEGIEASVEEMADARVRIAIAAGTDSLNVAVAAGIALHAMSTA